MANQGCCICLSPYGVGDRLWYLPCCFQALHESCAENHFARKNTCPLCKLKIGTEWGILAQTKDAERVTNGAEEGENNEDEDDKDRKPATRQMRNVEEL